MDEATETPRKLRAVMSSESRDLLAASTQALAALALSEAAQAVGTQNVDLVIDLPDVIDAFQQRLQ
jgi:hypothetical protein